MSDSSRSFTFKVTCTCGAEFYMSHMTEDGYGYSDTRTETLEKYDGWIEVHKQCTEQKVIEDLPADWRV